MASWLWSAVSEPWAADKKLKSFLITINNGITVLHVAKEPGNFPGSFRSLMECVNELRH